ncbi:MAG: hypothetical protein QXU54_00470 [Candidatus Micrarchaeia archaeon]
MPRVLVVYDTLFGFTEKIAKRLTEELGADAERIIEKKDKSGLLGALRPGKQLFVGRMVELAPTEKDPAAYDLVVIVSPVMFNTMPLPVRAYITKFKDKFKSVAVLVTGGVSTSNTIKDISYLCGKQPVAKMGITHPSYYSGLYKKKYQDFLRQIRESLGAQPPRQ